MLHRLIFLCTAIINCSLFSLASVVVPYKEFYFDQTIDHFNVYWKNYGKPTFKQRYLVQDKWWDSTNKGPIFLYTGNEGDITGFWDNCGFLFEIAPQFGALVLFAEHRFYGKSLPFGNESFRHPYVDLLTVEQALADFAVMVTSLKAQWNASDSRVIAFGGSYGGMLSAYMRFRYPNIVAGAIAASAPIYLVAGDSSRDTFFHDVTADFRKIDNCFDDVKSSFSQIASLAMTGASGFEKLSSEFRLCPAIKSTKDYRHLLGWLRNAFTVLAMMDYPYPTQFIAPLPANPVNVACEKFKSSTDLIAGMSHVADMVYSNGGKGGGCHDIFREYVECADPTGCGTGPASLAWDYQACTSFILPAGTDNVTDMFPPLSFTLQERKEYCQRAWDVTPRDRWTKISLWGKDITSSSNIVFSNGLLDPWCRGGVLRNISESLVAVLIEGGAHHLDLRSSNAADPPSVVTARRLEASFIANWIKDD